MILRVVRSKMSWAAPGRISAHHTRRDYLTLVTNPNSLPFYFSDGGHHMRESLHRSDGRRHSGPRRRGRFAAGAIAAAACAALFLAGLSSGGTAATKSVSVGAALLGPKNDRSYNQSVYTGLSNAKAKLGIKLTVVD